METDEPPFQSHHIHLWKLTVREVSAGLNVHVRLHGYTIAIAKASALCQQGISELPSSMESSAASMLHDLRYHVRFEDKKFFMGVSVGNDVRKLALH